MSIPLGLSLCLAPTSDIWRESLDSPCFFSVCDWSWEVTCCWAVCLQGSGSLHACLNLLIPPDMISCLGWEGVFQNLPQTLAVEFQNSTREKETARESWGEAFTTHSKILSVVGPQFSNSGDWWGDVEKSHFGGLERWLRSWVFAVLPEDLN